MSRALLILFVSITHNLYLSKGYLITGTSAGSPVHRDPLPAAQRTSLGTGLRGRVSIYRIIPGKWKGFSLSLTY